MTTAPVPLYDRVYAVTIAANGDPIGFKITGLRCTFSVKRNLRQEANTVDLKIHNLNPSHRKAVEQAQTCTVQIDAGYVQGSGTIFLGDLRTHTTTREGAHLVTNLACGDKEVAIRTSRISQSFRKGSTTVQILQALAASLDVDPGNISQAVAALAPFGQLFTMGTVVCGSSARELTRILKSVGYMWSIQNGKLQIISIKQALVGAALLVTPLNGLLDSPTVDKDGYLNCKTLMLPDCFPGRLMVLQSENLQGQYRIEETTHAGDTHGTDWDVTIKARKY